MEDGKLPEGWKWTTLAEASEIILGQSPSSETYNIEGKGLPFYQGKTEFGELYPTRVKWCSSPGKIAEAGDILISVRAPVGPTNLCQEKSCIGRGLAALRAKNGMPIKFLLFYLRMIEKEWDSKATGTTFKAITGEVLRQQEIPIPPINEQERIVAKIEELFTQLDAGTAALKRVQMGLKRYKASVLKAAVEGRLVVPGIEKRELDKGELPYGWQWVTVENIGTKNEQTVLTGPFGSTLGSDDFIALGTPVLTIGCLTERGIVLNKAKYISKEKASELDRYKVREGDLLFSRMATVGRAGLVTKEHAGTVINYHLMRLRLANDVIDPDFFLTYVRGAQTVVDYVKDVNHGATRDGINTDQLLGMPVILPPLAEQRQIVAEVERRLSLAQNQEAVVAAALARASRLRQAVLKAAFEGRLIA